MQTVTIYTKQGVCPWCDKTKDALYAHRIPFDEIKIRRKQDFPAGSDGTVPQVTINGYLIGGYRETLKWLNNGKDPNVVEKNPYKKGFNFKEKYD